MDNQIIPTINTKPNYIQNIHFTGSESKYSYQLSAQEVNITCSPGSHSHGSSKVKLTNVVDFNWEHKFYTGHLLSVHIGGKILAYGIKGKTSGMIRVANQSTGQRTLIKEITGLVVDLSFAHIPTQIILAAVIEDGNLFVYNVDEQPDSIICTKLLHVVHSSLPLYHNKMVHRVIWCPWLPDEESADPESDDVSKLLVLTHGSKAELWNVATVNMHYGVGPLTADTMYEGYLEINEHSSDIIDATFSPDGTALATASLDGMVKFFQVYMHDDKKPRCLHEWRPHGGKPLSCLFFLDNHSNFSPDIQFWKFAITGTNHNSELKLWSCESWTCLQTITFLSNPNSLSIDIFLKARLDESAGYLVLSDINNRILYVLHLETSEVSASVRSISEFLVPASFLSFGILDATTRKFRCSTDSEDHQDLYRCEEGGEDFDEESIIAVLIRMYVVQPKRLQECHIAFQPDRAIRAELTMSQGTSDNHTKEISDNGEVLSRENHFPDLSTSVNLLMQQAPPQSLNLMTPEAFSSPARNSTPNESRSSISGLPVVDATSSPAKSLELLEKSNEENDESLLDADLINFQRPQKETFASGGSSPSREVQEIMSLNNSFTAHDYFEDKIENTGAEILQPKSSNFNQQENLIYPENDVWPNIPIMKANEIMKSEENRRQEENMNEFKWQKSQIQTLSYRLNSLEDLIREQSSQIQKLHNEIKVLAMQNDKTALTEDFDNIVAKQLDVALSRAQLQQAKHLENFLNARTNKEREVQENLVQSVSQVLGKQINDKLQTLINHEIKHCVVPAVINTFETMKHQLSLEYTQKLNTTDHMLKDNLTKLISSKMVSDSLSNSVVHILRPSIEKCYKETVGTSLLPSWEKVCTNMFQQINETFLQGTKEYTASVEAYMERQRKTQEKGKEIINNLQITAEAMRTTTDKLSHNLSKELQHQIAVSFSGIQDKFIGTISDLIREQVSLGFKNHAAMLEDSVMHAVRSRAVTPSPHVIDTQLQLTQIQQLLAKGNVNQAFQQALSASDLSLVVYVCEKVNPQELFGQETCPLQQHVLLSLIQQLGADMTQNTEIKHRYLEEAVLNLQPSNPMTREHVPKVLKDLLRQLSNFITNNPNHKMCRSLRMLQMATQSLLKS